MGGRSDAAWMVRKVREELCRCLDAHDPRDTKDILQEIMADIRKDYLQVLDALGEAAPDDSPSAGFSLFRERDGQLEFFGLGDCVGVADLPGEKNFYSLDTVLPNLDHTALEEMLRYCKKTGCTMPEAKKHFNHILIENRKQRNAPGGYWILDLLSDAGLANARTCSWPLDAPVPAGAFSDGFAQLAEVFGFYKGYSGLFDAMQTTNLEEMFQQLCDAQNRDPGCINFPRFKLRDDTCAIWGIFQPD